MKHIKVEDNTHEKAKSQAKSQGMTLMGYIKKLVNDDIKNTVISDRWSGDMKG